MRVRGTCETCYYFTNHIDIDLAPCSLAKEDEDKLCLAYIPTDRTDAWQAQVEKVVHERDMLQDALALANAQVKVLRCWQAEARGLLEEAKQDAARVATTNAWDTNDGLWTEINEFLRKGIEAVKK